MPEVRIENDSDRKKSYKKLFSMFYATLITMSRKYFFVFLLEISFLDRKSSISHNILKVFLETTLVHVSCYPDHYKPKIFFRFSKFATSTTLRYPILDSRFPLKMRSQKAGLPSATRARKRGLCLQRYVSRMTRTGNSKIFKNIS